MENRVIKFRVWDNVDYMSTPFTLEDLQSDKIEFTSDCPIMQFTGLLDKAKTEIYESDILRWKFNDEDRLYEVFWDDTCGRWLVKNLHDKTDITHILHDSFTEVVGNKYSTPELLNQK